MKKPIVPESLEEAVEKTGHGGPGLDSSYPLGLALSGGGHRAALFGIGVLMAMRDAGRLPKQISSVSGGSITNAVLAHNYFSRLRHLDESVDPMVIPESAAVRKNLVDTMWDEETQKLYESIVGKGAVTKTWVWFLFAFLILPPVALLVLAVSHIVPP